MATTFAAPLQNTRNVTIVAHVDHGKTSFADSLLSSNNIISSRMAGKLRFLDSREDEQERGITMESSAVSLRFDMMRPGPDGKPVAAKHVCNLIDTPGHVDFASEVSTASRLCDGALVLVDVWEGVCTQTIAVLRRAWIDRLRPLLVINKMDRLITELQLSPSEAYHHIARLIEQVNAVMGSFYASERMEDDLRWREAREKRLAERAEAAANGEMPEDTPEEEYEEREDEDIYFSPERGNVLFASAIDGWAFRLGKFARLYADKLGVKEANLRRVLWGDWFLDPKTKRVVSRKGLNGRPLKPLFVQFVLENIWRVYNTVLNEYNPDANEKIVKALGVRVSPRELRAKDTRPLLTSIMQQWLPLSVATFQAIVDVIPSPKAAQAVRIPFMLHPEAAAASSTPLPARNPTEEALYACDQSERAPLVTYVSKMFAVRRGDLPEHRPREMTAEEMRERGRIERERRAADKAAADKAAEELGRPLQELSLLDETAPAHIAAAEAAANDEDAEVLLGFARVFASTLRRGDRVTVTLPKYDAELGAAHKRNARYVRSAVVGDLYMMMGRDLTAVESVPAGHVCAVAGLDGLVHRAGTLNAPGNADLVNLASVSTGGAPILRVALEPVNPSEMPKLIAGLKVLNNSDPCAEYLVQETGEHVILTAGELHLERCVRDLQERFARCDLTVSEPIVPFRETAVKAPDMPPPKEGGARGTATGSMYDGLVEVQVRAVPLPARVTEFLLAHQSTIASMFTKAKPKKARALGMGERGETAGAGADSADGAAESDEEEEEEEEDGTVEDRTDETRALPVEEFWSQLAALFATCGPEWAGAADRIWAFGPRKVGANVLLDPAGSAHSRLRQREAAFAAARERGKSAAEALAAAQAEAGGSVEVLGEDGVAERIARDFDHSVEAGFQLANLQGPLCAEPVTGMAYVVEHVRYDASKANTSPHAVVGSLISTVRDCCRQGLLDWSPRIKLAMYSCDIQASTDVLGKVYAVLAKRRGKILSEEMKHGTSFFTISAEMPVVESFGFIDEIRKKTSGGASPQLIFKGFEEVLGINPFWVPTTQEELEDLGEIADRENPALVYVEQVRKRKGLEVKRRLVVSAEKQRTLKR